MQKVPSSPKLSANVPLPFSHKSSANMNSPKALNNGNVNSNSKKAFIYLGSHTNAKINNNNHSKNDGNRRNKDEGQDRQVQAFRKGKSGEDKESKTKLVNGGDSKRKQGSALTNGSTNGNHKLVIKQQKQQGDRCGTKNTNPEPDSNQLDTDQTNNSQFRKLQDKLKNLESKIHYMKKKNKQSASHRSQTAGKKTKQKEREKKEKSLLTNKTSSVGDWKKEKIGPNWQKYYHGEKDRYEYKAKDSKQQKDRKILKKSYSDKLAVKMANNYHNKNANYQQAGKVSNTPKSRNKQTKVSTNADQKEQELIHKFVTQVPKHDLLPPAKNMKLNSKNKLTTNSVQKIHLKDSVADSLRKNLHFNSKKQQQFENDPNTLYYIQNALKSMVNPNLLAVREHLVQSIQTLIFLQNVKKPSLRELEPHCVSLPPSRHEYSIILDLDETLIHCNQSIHLEHDVTLTIKFPTGQKIQAGVNIRPYAVQFIREVSKFAEVIIFTASHQCYANVVLDHLDPHNRYISHRLFRQHCWQTEQGIYIKDLRVVGNRSLKNILLVDNAAYSYFYQLENGIPIVPYYDGKTDQELIVLLQYLKGLIDGNKNNQKYKFIQQQGFVQTNKEYFKLSSYGNFDDPGIMVRNLYEETVLRSKES